MSADGLEFGIALVFALMIFVPLVLVSTLLFAFCEPRTKAARIACFHVPTVVVLTGFYFCLGALSTEGFALLGAAMGIAAAFYTMSVIRRRVLLQWDAM